MDDEMGGVRRGKTSCHHPFDEPRKSICLVLVTIDHLFFFYRCSRGFVQLGGCKTAAAADKALCQWGQKNGQTEYARPHVFQAPLRYQGHKR